VAVEIGSVKLRRVCRQIATRAMEWPAAAALHCVPAQQPVARITAAPLVAGFGPATHRVPT